MAGLTQQGAVDIVNEFIGDNGYYDRLPEATLANVLDVQTEIANNPRMVNEFMETMFNKIVGTYVNMPVFSNPLKRFKRETQVYGDTIEEVFVGLAEELVYDSDPKGTGARLLSTEEMKIQAAYHNVNRESTFKGTVLQKQMVRALTSSDGLSRLVSGIINSLTSSNEVNEYKYMKSLLDSAYRAGDTYLVEVGDITQPDNKFAQKARQYALDIEFPHRFNAAGVENVSSLDGVTIFISNLARSVFDTTTLAGAFNMDKTDLMGAQIGVDKFHDDNVYAVLVDNSFFIVQDKMPAQMSSQRFADSLKTNYFLHVDQIISRSPFATSIAFVKEIPADMKYKLHVSKDSVVLDDFDDSQEIFTKLIGFDELADIEDYTLEVEAGSPSIVTTTVDENNVLTLKLKANIPAGEKENITLVAKAAGVSGKEVSHKRVIRVQKSAKIRLEG